MTGTQLEELLHGLLEAMGACLLTWRAGSATGVTASDGGRDLEAVFDRPSPDGELDRQRWWIECKGRTSTVEREAVQKAVLDAGARTDIDILVIATNSRFSNPTRDWLEEWTRTHPRPSIKLWDRDRLDRLVRRHPEVAARILPEALTDQDRLQLLAARFEEFGEEPTLADLDYYWDHKDWLMALEPKIVAEAAAMFLYAEGITLQHRRQWWHIITSTDVPHAVIHVLANFPQLLGNGSLPRPVEHDRFVASAARIIISCLTLEPASAMIILNPWKYTISADGKGMPRDDQQLKSWQLNVLRPILAFIQADLLDACSSDCSRVTADNPHEIDSLGGKDFWQAIFEGTDPGKSIGTIVIERLNEECVIGLDMSARCPLIVSNERDCGQLLSEIAAILRFRQENPENAANPKDFSGGLGPAKVTILEQQGLSWYTLDA